MLETLFYKKNAVFRFIFFFIFFSTFFCILFFLEVRLLYLVFIFVLMMFPEFIRFIIDIFTRIFINDEYLEKRVLFLSWKIYHRNVNSIEICENSEWITGNSGGDFYEIYIKETSGKKVTIRLDKLLDEDIIKLFKFLVSHVDSIKNDNDFIEISKGDISYERLDKICSRGDHDLSPRATKIFLICSAIVTILLLFILFKYGTF